MALCFVVRDSWDQQDKASSAETTKSTEQGARPSVGDAVQLPDFERRPTSRMSGRVSPLTARPVDSLPLVDDDDGGSRMSVQGRSTDFEAGSPTTVDAIGRMRRKRSRAERTRRRERSLARLSTGGESLSSVEKTQYLDASGDRVALYRTSPPTQFPSQLPRIEQTRTADDDVGNLLPSSNLGPTATSWKGLADDEEALEKIVSSRTSTPGKLRSMLVESGVGSMKTETEDQQVTHEAATDFAETPTARRLSYAMQRADDYGDATEIADVEPETSVPVPTTAPTTSASTHLDAVVASESGPKFVTALSVPPIQHAASAVELQRIMQSFSSNSLAASDLPSQPSSTTSKAALLHRRRAGSSATSDIPAQPSLTKHAHCSSVLDVTDVPAQPSLTKHARRSSVLDVTDVPAQPSLTKHAHRSSVLDVTDVPAQPSLTKHVRRSSILDVSDVPLKPSVTKASKPAAAHGKPSAPSLDDIAKQRMRILGRPPDDGYSPMLQTPLADSEWDTVYEEDLSQSSKPYPFYRTPVMRSTLRSPSPPAKARRSWVRAPPGGWSQHSDRRYSVPRLSPPKFIQRRVRYCDAHL